MLLSLILVFPVGRGPQIEVVAPAQSLILLPLVPFLPPKLPVRLLASISPRFTAAPLSVMRSTCFSFASDVGRANLYGREGRTMRIGILGHGLITWGGGIGFAALITSAASDL